MPEAVVIVLDRPLTDREQATPHRLEGGGNKAAVWACLESLGGRLIEYTFSADHYACLLADVGLQLHGHTSLSLDAQVLHARKTTVQGPPRA
ncbi:hypothetical protein [Streptomyces sp. NPDC097981]|uniref:hypothetical protein n=1 Tax=Streptomyces sp. NPDC097981 TaxID=3155428 RepID=UPI00333059F4